MQNSLYPGAIWMSFVKKKIITIPSIEKKNEPLTNFTILNKMHQIRNEVKCFCGLKSYPERIFGWINRPKFS